MPALRKTRTQRSYEILSEYITAKLFAKKMTPKILAQRIAMPESTLRARRRNIGRFELADLNRIFDVLEFSDRDRVEFVLGKKIDLFDLKKWSEI